MEEHPVDYGVAVFVVFAGADGGGAGASHLPLADPCSCLSIEAAGDGGTADHSLDRLGGRCAGIDVEGTNTDLRMSLGSWYGPCLGTGAYSSLIENVARNEDRRRY